MARISPSLVSLIVANVLPLFGVLFLGWDLFSILLLYWLESGVIGFYNIFKISMVSGGYAFLFVPFFIMHFSGFMAGHLLFIIVLFASGSQHSGFSLYEAIGPPLQAQALPIVMLFLSHGMSFFLNFIGHKEYKRTNAMKQLGAPYARIMIMHITIIFGGMLVLLLKQPIWGLVLLIALKLFLDVRSHIREHALLQNRTPISKSTGGIKFSS